MSKLLPLTAAVWALSFGHAPPGKFTPVDLAPHINQKMTDNLGSGRDGNNLINLPKGGGTFAGVNFKLGKGIIQLGSKLLAKEQPNKIEGIKVGATCAKIHILHATGYGNGQNIGQEGKAGDPLYVADGTAIAEYRVHYDDGTKETIPVVYGQDVRDWWFAEGAKGVTRGKVAWKGDNELTRDFGCHIRLYLTTWDNPHPNKKITTIDYVKTAEDTPAAPFCAGITLEAK
jgi:hypothetical protein